MSTQTSIQGFFTVRRIVITGVLAAIAIFLGATQLGFIPVPNLSGSATIMHVPAIIGGVLEGPIVGALVGGIFGLYSMLQDTSGLFKNPIVSVIPRILIGVAAYYTYAALKNRNEYLALAMAGVVGTLTNTVLVVGALVGLSLIPAEVVPTIIPQAIAEIIIATIITVAVVAAWKRLDTGRGSSV